MPELPEVETIRRELVKKIIGKKIKKVTILKPKSFQGNPKKINGLKITSIKRRGKLFIFDLEKCYLLIHLKMSGQLLISLNKDKYTRVIIEFSDGSQLLFNDLRIFGWMRIVSSYKLKVISLKLGPEPFDKEFTNEYLEKIFSKTSKAIKLVLMDQDKISGIGNIYANEILFAAGIKPLKQAKKLSNEEMKKLREVTISVLKKAIKYQGSTAKDDNYRLPDGSSGSFQNHFMVYQRDGQKCKKCGALIKRIKMGGRGTFWCPKCQH